MLTFPNILSFTRMPLAFVFIFGNPTVRTIAVLTAMVTDVLDGFLARRRKQISQFGAFLDPLMDKFFVIVALSVLLSEKPLETWKIAAFLCRDFSVVIFGGFLAVKGMLKNYQLRSIICGKISTTLQMFVLMALTWQYPIPSYVFLFFIVLGVLALLELYRSTRISCAI